VERNGIIGDLGAVRVYAFERMVLLLPLDGGGVMGSLRVWAQGRIVEVLVHVAVVGHRDVDLLIILGFLGDSEVLRSVHPVGSRRVGMCMMMRGEFSDS